MIRRANEKDINDIDKLLLQVRAVHRAIRKDLFRTGTKKYTDDELIAIIKNDNTPVFVYEKDGKVIAHAFCILEKYDNEKWVEHKTLYIDDICVDEASRGKGTASSLVDYVKDYAKKIGCYNITLNVWKGNDNAEKLYSKLGFTPYKTSMEIIL